MNLFQKTAAGVALACAATALHGQSTVGPVFGYSDFTAESKIESEFLAIPDAKLGGQHLKTLTAQPHLSATPEDKATADYVAQKFRAAGLETEIVPYRVLLNRPIEQHVEAFDAAPMRLSVWLYFSEGYFRVPRNMRCSKRCAKPLLPGSTSLREPVLTTM